MEEFDAGEHHLRRRGKKRTGAQKHKMEDKDNQGDKRSEAKSETQIPRSGPTHGRPTVFDEKKPAKRKSKLTDLAGRVGEGCDIARASRRFCRPGQDDKIDPGHETGKGHREEKGKPTCSRGDAAGSRKTITARMFVLLPAHGPWSPRQCRAYRISATTRRTSMRNFFSATAAVARISSSTTGSSASGKQISVITDRPRLRSPQWTPTMTSGTVDMPKDSAPIPRKKRYSARVSRFGPGTATKTPLWQAIFSSWAIFWVKAMSARS